MCIFAIYADIGHFSFKGFSPSNHSDVLELHYKYLINGTYWKLTYLVLNELQIINFDRQSPKFFLLDFADVVKAVFLFLLFILTFCILKFIQICSCFVEESWRKKLICLTCIEDKSKHYRLKYTLPKTKNKI